MPLCDEVSLMFGQITYAVHVVFIISFAIIMIFDDIRNIQQRRFTMNCIMITIACSDKSTKDDKFKRTKISSTTSLWLIKIHTSQYPEINLIMLLVST